MTQVNETKKSSRHVIVVGCGGIGAWLAMALYRTLTAADAIILVDGDTIETRNLDRQLFDTSHVGMNKAGALTEQLMARATGPKVLASGNWFTDRWLDTYVQAHKDQAQIVVMVAADNNAARTVALRGCATHGLPCIVAANEYDDAEGYIKLPQWHGSEHDPLFYYPELASGGGFNPAAPACTGEIQTIHPQLAIANMNAAAYAMWLFHAWLDEREGRTPEAFAKVPYFIRSTWGRVFTHSVERPFGST